MALGNFLLLIFCIARVLSRDLASSMVARFLLVFFDSLNVVWAGRSNTTRVYFLCLWKLTFLTRRWDEIRAAFLARTIGDDSIEPE